VKRPLGQMLVGLWRKKWIYFGSSAWVVSLSQQLNPRRALAWGARRIDDCPDLDAQHLGGLLYGDWLGLDVAGF